ncbi:hypothetical protein llap_18255 [Limosa lapponica baueri]|uniref:Rna-directed dna polymerase from mobile element jockey-like n=1 Tax=Limosa lapponica baueri TaxID=1758121 RepID=A0A2I0TCC5_LIMLA|nr:hypothetical protein llap_18255 [Limosa lapponica baueri]
MLMVALLLFYENKCIKDCEVLWHHVSRLSGAADAPEGWDVIQKDLDRFKKWVYVNLMRFNKAKCRVLHLGQGNPQLSIQAGG